MLTHTHTHTTHMVQAFCKVPKLAHIYNIPPPLLARVNKESLHPPVRISSSSHTTMVDNKQRQRATTRHDKIKVMESVLKGTKRSEGSVYRLMQNDPVDFVQKIQLETHHIVSVEHGSCYIGRQIGKGLHTRVMEYDGDRVLKQYFMKKKVTVDPVTGIQVVEMETYADYLTNVAEMLKNELVVYLECFDYEERQRIAIHTHVTNQGFVLYGIVLPYMGRSLYSLVNERIYARQLLMPSDVVRLGLGTLVELRRLQKHKYVHGDLKLDNIVVQTKKTGEFVVRLVDFNISKKYRSMHPLRASHLPCDDMYSDRYDVFSFGILLSELLKATYREERVQSSITSFLSDIAKECMKSRTKRPTVSTLIECFSTVDVDEGLYARPRRTQTLDFTVSCAQSTKGWYNTPDIAA